MTYIHDQPGGIFLQQMSAAPQPITARDPDDLLDVLHYEQTRTEAVIAPLMTTSYDAVDVACALQAAGHVIPLHVIAPKMPQPDIVLRDLRQAAPDIEIALIIP